MSTPTRTPEEHLPLSVPVYQILLSVTDRALHGYAIIQDVRERTGGAVDLTASTLYGAVRRMLEAGLVRELDRVPDPEDHDSRRRYYAITPHGRRVAAVEARRLREAAAMAAAKGLIAPEADELRPS